MLGKGLGGGLRKVSVQEGEDLVELTDKALIENAIHAENVKKFSQIESTPAMLAPLVEELGFLGNNKICKRILEGTYQPPTSIDIYSKAFLKALSKPLVIINPPKAEITTEKFRAGWREMKEATSSGNLGIYFGHMKACD